MGKIKYKLTISLFAIVLLVLLTVCFIYLNKYSSIEYKMMKIEHGWSIYKLLGIVPEKYREQIKITIKEENLNFTLFKITKLDSENSYLYIKFRNKNEGFLKGKPGDPSKGTGEYLCTAINIDFFNEYVKGINIHTKDSIEAKYIQILGDFSDLNSIKRIRNIDQMWDILKGTSLRTREGQDTINLRKLNIEFNKDLFYWIPYEGFFNLKFNYNEDNLLKSVDCKQIGILDATLLHL